MIYLEVRPKTYTLLFHCPCCEGCMKTLKKIKGVEAPLEVDVYANKVTISVTGDIQTIISELKCKTSMFSKILPDEQNQHEDEPSELQIVPVEDPVQKEMFSKILPDEQNQHEDGYGPRYKWNGHNPYEIHEECKNPKITVTHELFSGSTFELSNRLEHADPCIACGKSVCGRFYHCKESKLNLHPLCANLKVKKYFSGYCFVLRMELSNNCLRCKKKEVDGGKSLSYESTEDPSCCLHVRCIMEMIQEASKRSGDWYEDAVSLTSTSVNARNKDVSKNRNKGKYDYIIDLASILIEVVIPMLVGGPAALLVVAVGRLLKVIIMKGYSHWRKQLRQEMPVAMLVGSGVIAKLIDKKASSQLQHSMTPKHESSQLQLVPVKNLQKAMYQQTGSVEVTVRPPRSIAEKRYDRQALPHQPVWELKNYNKRFLCDICCEGGYGPRFKWNGHNPYEIHEECKNPKITITHELFSGSTFELRNWLEHADPCIACGKSVCGRFYHCKESKLNLHPLCANLKVKKYFSGYCFVLRMELSNNCLRCKKKEVDWGKSWSYESRVDASCCLHVHCIMELIQEAWKRSGDWYEDAVSLESASVNAQNTDVSKNINKGKYDYIIDIASILLEVVIPILVGCPAALLVVAVGRLLKVIIMKGYSHWRKQLRQEVVAPMLVECPVSMLVGN